jgi:hypothetical protein
MTTPFHATKAGSKMSTGIVPQTELISKIASFEKTLDELRLLKKASMDLRKYKKMLQLKRFD